MFILHVYICVTLAQFTAPLHRCTATRLIFTPHIHINLARL